MVTTHPSDRAWAAWQHRGVRHQRVAGPGTPPIFVSRTAGAQSNPRRTTAPLPLLSRASSPKDGRSARAAPLSAIANRSMCPSTRWRKRRPRSQRQKHGRGSETRSMDKLRQCTTIRNASAPVPGNGPNPSRASPTRTCTRTRRGTTLEKALTRALTGATL